MIEGIVDYALTVIIQLHFLSNPVDLLAMNRLREKVLRVKRNSLLKNLFSFAQCLKDVEY